jgi:hypothetical protein
MTQTAAIVTIRALGMTASSNDGEIRVDFKLGDARRTPDSAYFTNDPQDALDTARHMVTHNRPFVTLSLNENDAYRLLDALTYARMALEDVQRRWTSAATAPSFQRIAGDKIAAYQALYEVIRKDIEGA